MRALIALAFAAAVLAGCNSESSNDITGSINDCASKLYSPYNPRDLKQCVAVCITCQRGVTTTCSTSCTMKGAK